MRKNIYILLTAVLILSLALLFVGCAGDGTVEDDRIYYYPTKLTVNFYDDPSEPPIFTYTDEDYNKNADEIAAAMPVLEKEGYVFRGYYTEPSEKGKTYPSGKSVFSDGAADSATFNDLLVKSPTPIDEKTVNVYAYSDGYFYRFLYEASFIENYFYRDKRMQERREWASYAGIDYYEKAMGGYDDLMEVAGWRTLNTSEGELIFDYKGDPVLSLDEMYEKFKPYLVLGNEINHSQKFIYLYPIWDYHFSVITLDYGVPGVETGYMKLYNGTMAEDAELPTGAYENGRYLLGWTTEREGKNAFEGEITEDRTLYAVWVDAREIDLYVEDLDEPLTYYVLADGRVIGELPSSLYKYGIDKWFLDEARTSVLTPSYKALEGVTSVYVSLIQNIKEVTLNPATGDASYTVSISRDSGASITLPVWDGYELIGWYRQRDYSGEPVELDFKSVTDGETYYAKWQKIN